MSSNALRVSTEGRAYQTAFLLLIVGGWMILAKPQNLFSSSPRIQIAGAPSAPSASAKPEILETPANAALRKAISDANARIGEGALGLEISDDGARAFTIRASSLLLTDKGRPRISRAASEAIQPALNGFVGSAGPRRKVTIEASAETPEAYIRPLKKYFEVYKGWPVARATPETAGVFRVRIQGAK